MISLPGLLLTLAGGYGVWLVFTAFAYRWPGVAPVPGIRRASARPTRAVPTFAEWLAQAGLDEVKPREFAGVLAGIGVAGGLAGWALFGGALPAVACGGLAACFPPAAYRARRERRMATARAAWPRMIEEIRVRTSSIGRSVPQALFEVGRNGPLELRPAFEAAEREWLLSTDFTRTVDVLRARLADATADAVCETLLVAYELGGTDLDSRLAALAEDRVIDVNGRRDAEAKQAGVRFARRFVLVVPVGMALAGSAIGTGRTAYGTPAGQALVVAGLLVVAGCWVWAGRLLRLPAEERVFTGGGGEQ